MGVELDEGGAGVGAVAGDGGDVEERHLGFEGVDVDVVDFGVGARLALGWYPRYIAVKNEDYVCRFE